MHYWSGMSVLKLGLRALTQDKMPADRISPTFFVGIALCAIGVHAAPQPVIELLGNRFHNDLKEEDRKFVTDPSANSDGNLKLYYINVMSHSE
jgi:hypothetical protein